MKILVTGANGFVGRAVCAALHRRGHRVRKAVRNLPTGHHAETGGEIVAVGDIDGQTDWTQALQGVEAIVHLAGRAHVMRERAADPLAEFRRVNVAGTERLARSAAASGVKRLVFVSSVKVSGEATGPGERLTEDAAAAPQDPYGISKLEAEQALQSVAADTGLETVIVRPPLVYGPGVKGNFRSMLKALGSGIPLPLASIHNLRSLIYVENLADALIACVVHPAAAGQTYLVSDGEDVSTPALLRVLGKALGKPAWLLPLPMGLLRALAKLTEKGPQLDRLLGSLCVDSGKIRGQLEWMPPHTLQQGLQATAEWYRSENYL